MAIMLPCSGRKTAERIQGIAAHYLYDVYSTLCGYLYGMLYGYLCGVLYRRNIIRLVRITTIIILRLVDKDYGDFDGARLRHFVLLTHPYCGVVHCFVIFSTVLLINDSGSELRLRTGAGGILGQ